MRNVERAILSVSDKTGIVDLARARTARGVETLSTGGAAKHRADNGIAVTPIATWSGAPEILGGRVKTLTPRAFGAILFDRDNAAHGDDGAPPPLPPARAAAAPRPTPPPRAFRGAPSSPPTPPRRRPTPPASPSRRSTSSSST